MWLERLMPLCKKLDSGNEAGSPRNGGSFVNLLLISSSPVRSAAQMGGRIAGLWYRTMQETVNVIGSKPVLEIFVHRDSSLVMILALISSNLVVYLLSFYRLHISIIVLSKLGGRKRNILALLLPLTSRLKETYAVNLTEKFLFVSADFRRPFCQYQQVVNCFIRKQADSQGKNHTSLQPDGFMAIINRFKCSVASHWQSRSTNWPAKSCSTQIRFLSRDIGTLHLSTSEE